MTEIVVKDLCCKVTVEVTVEIQTSSPIFLGISTVQQLRDFQNKYCVWTDRLEAV